MYDKIVVVCIFSIGDRKSKDSGPNGIFYRKVEK
jgi:hypothetical protein